MEKEVFLDSEGGKRKVMEFVKVGVGLNRKGKIYGVARSTL